ncbi:cobalt ABC transporter ATPase [Thermincola ferriacetica]|uniref:ABC transporter ATP-binding protein n=1 Tax=Thermincola ferriacetica TaxID=281456 RepID=A0A0L6W7R9_9FIRM|nr:ATP-binding cassette domain-containing protein [Thermincola ferriacetica]KNZ71144.1 cobalt ABC transporter ATPase [Thermincola ferriacetica]
MNEYIIEAEELEFTYPDGTRALKGASLRIRRGAKIALLGSNGAGKSTLFLHFNGILKPQKGKLRFNGVEVKYDKKSLLQLRKDVGVVFQDPDTQLFSASVYQEISFGPLNMGLSRETAREKVLQAMEDTGISELKDKPTHFLSYGQKKRVSIADVLAMDPKVIIADEPTVWLDPKHAKQIECLFRDINEKGTTVIISTHDVDLAYAWADYIFVIHEGKIIGEGNPEDIFADDILIRKAGLERPWILDITGLLIEKGFLTNKTPYPRNKKELIKMINCTKYLGGTENQYDLSTFRDEGRDANYIPVGRTRK